MGREEGARQGKEAGRVVAVEPRLEVGRRRLGRPAKLRTSIAASFVSFLEGRELRYQWKIFDKGLILDLSTPLVNWAPLHQRF